MTITANTRGLPCILAHLFPQVSPEMVPGYCLVVLRLQARGRWFETQLRPPESEVLDVSVEIHLRGWALTFCRSPEPVERQDRDPVIVCVRVFAGVQDDRFLQPGAEALFQLAETAEFFAADLGACLDLDGDYLTIVAL